MSLKFTFVDVKTNKGFTMTWRGFFEGLGDFAEWAFQGLVAINGWGNIFFSLAMTVAGAYWIGQMIAQQRRGEQ